MKKQYILGVDGGNTKTDYFLFDTQGKFVSHLRTGTCSHEKFEDGYEGAYRVMKDHIQELLAKQDLTVEAIEVGVFGLAGLDVPIQKENLEKVIQRLGFKKFIADNDGYLGLKAGSKSGHGVCSINGTGTVTTGIDPRGNRLQVGGIGYISGDDAGGGFITRELFREVYNALYRCGQKTRLTGPVLELLQVEDKHYYIQAINKLYANPFSHTPYIQLVFEQALSGDAIALKIMDKVALELAKSTVGCMNNLYFEKEDTVEIILAGSVWVKPSTTILMDKYKAYVESLTSFKCQYTLLQVPPAIGAILWALEVLYNHSVDITLRKQIVREMEKLFG